MHVLSKQKYQIIQSNLQFNTITSSLECSKEKTHNNKPADIKIKTQTSLNKPIINKPNSSVSYYKVKVRTQKDKKKEKKRVKSTGRTKITSRGNNNPQENDDFVNKGETINKYDILIRDNQTLKNNIIQLQNRINHLENEKIQLIENNNKMNYTLINLSSELQRISQIIRKKENEYQTIKNQLNKNFNRANRNQNGVIATQILEKEVQTSFLAMQLSSISSTSNNSERMQEKNTYFKNWTQFCEKNKMGRQGQVMLICKIIEFLTHNNISVINFTSALVFYLTGSKK